MIATTVNATDSAVSLRPGPNRVTFQSEGETLVGTLHLPASYRTGDKLPAVVVTGSWTTVKEQMAGLYASKLAEAGYAALAFDFRYFGESGGQPRQYEWPAAKVRDIRKALCVCRSSWSTASRPPSPKVRRRSSVGCRPRRSWSG